MVKACCGKLGLKKGTWSAEEDHRLVSHIQMFGHENWRSLPQQAGLLRCGKSCRFRWMNYLRPDIKRGDYSKEEEEVIIRLQNQLGNKWSFIAKSLPGRTDNEIKNYWNTHLQKRNKEKRAMPKIKSEPSTTKSEFAASRQLMTLEYPGYNQVPPPRSFSSNQLSENESSTIISKMDNEVIEGSISSQWLAEIFTSQGHSSSTIEDQDMQFPLSPSSFVEYDVSRFHYNTEVDFQFNFYDGGELHDIFRGGSWI